MQSPRKKPKIVKDAPVFVRGPTRGEVRYAPFVYTSTTTSNSNADNDDGDVDADGEEDDEQAADKGLAMIKKNLQAYHDQFSVYPRQEDIGEYPRFIPYNSERRIFADATGRDFFEGMSTSSPILSVPGGGEERVFR